MRERNRNRNCVPKYSISYFCVLLSFFVTETINAKSGKYIQYIYISDGYKYQKGFNGERGFGGGFTKSGDKSCSDCWLVFFFFF